MSTYLGAALKRRLYPTVLCYHGCVARRQDVLTFRESAADVRSHVRMLQQAGYTFLLPSAYKVWQDGSVSYDTPVTCLHFDDGLESIDLIVPWLIEQGIPCGLSLITRRLGIIDADDGFASWEQIGAWVATGLVEIVCHTHNLHHLTLLPTDAGVDVGPVLEGPCWVDDGDVVYRATGDARWYWDFSFVDQTSLGVPLFGTDPYDAATPITTTLTMRPKVSGTVTTLRLWMALSKPSSAGYDAQVQIRADGVLVWDGIIAPKVYSTRSQWVEREFYSIELDTPFAITSGTLLELEFETLNSGAGVALLYALPDGDPDSFKAETTCRGLYLEGSQPPPNRAWQYIDYPANSRWPVRPCVILGFGTGAPASDVQYQGYVEADLAQFQAAVDNWPAAVWSEDVLWDVTPTYWNYRPVGWAGTTKYRATVPLNGANRTYEYLRIEVGPPEFFKGGEGDPSSEFARDNPQDFAALSREAGDRSYAAAFNLYVDGGTVAQEDPVVAAGGQIDMQDVAGPDRVPLRVLEVEDAVGLYTQLEYMPHDENGAPLPIPDRSFYYDAVTYTLLMPLAADGVDLRVQFIVTDLLTASASPAAIWRITKNLAQDIEPTNLAGNLLIKLVIDPINQTPEVGTEQTTRWGVRKIIGGYRSAALPITVDVDQIAYPFGSYYAEGEGVIQQRPGFKDIGTALKSSLEAAGYTHGYTIQGFRNVPAVEFREPDLRQTEWALGRWIVFGDQAAAVSQNNLAALSGMLYQDVTHRGVHWQASLEADPQGNATVRSRPQVLDFVAFDAWGFDGAGGIEPFPLNDGGTYDSEVYADDKGWLQARGVRCLLIINNNLGTGEPDDAIASHVVNNAATYIPLIVAVAVDDGWDGITCNLEAVPAADRAAATAFYVDLARAMHAAGKILHATVPAATGTDYDAEFWTGWCDHFAIAKVCDAIKVMSYTETGPGTDPGPAAPDEFWTLVYDRMRRVIAEPYWPRVLCGARAFGHLWDLAGGTTDYITYHQGIAEALNYAKRIDTRDTEAGWGTDTLRAWFGTPATVDRAQREAAASFGGIGLWKLDDGDIEEFFPAVRQIGRDEDMSFLDTRFPESISFGSTGGPAFNTSVVESLSGDEARNARRTLPLCEYDAAVGVRTQAQADAVRDLFMVARGRLHTFRYKDWQDFNMTSQVIGTADGVLTTFQLVKEYTVGAYTLTRPITLPVDGTLTVYRNGVSVGGWTVNLLTGLVSFASPPAAGVISATCEFDVKARFDTDRLPVELVTRNRAGILFQPGTIPLVERRA